MKRHKLFAKFQRQGIKQVKNRGHVLIIYVNIQQNIQSGLLLFFF